MSNNPHDELREAAEEQRQITHLRLAKLIERRTADMITTHVLDIARGVPAAGVTVILEVRQAERLEPGRPGNHRREGRLTTLTERPAIARARIG